MTGITRKFTATRTRLVQGEIADAAGWAGWWPFRRAVSYHVGVNCDSIQLDAGRLVVRRCGRTIATGAVRNVKGLRWTAFLHPRHARAGEEAQDETVRWEDLLRPRDPRGR